MKDSLDFVKIDTAIINDDDFLDLPATAKALAVLSIARSGFDGSDGKLRDDVRAIMRYSGLTENEIIEAKAALLAVCFWTQDETGLYITNWDRYQITSDERDALRKKRVAAGRKGGKKSGLVRKIKASGKQDLNQNEALASSLLQNNEANAKQNEAEVEVEVEVEEEKESLPATPVSASSLKKTILDGLRELAPDYPGLLLGDLLTQGLETADALATKYDGQTKSKDLRGFLRGAVGAEAIDLAWGEDAAGSYSWAQRIVKLEGEPALHAIVKASHLSDKEAMKGFVVNQLKGL